MQTTGTAYERASTAISTKSSSVSPSHTHGDTIQCRAAVVTGFFLLILFWVLNKSVFALLKQKPSSVVANFRWTSDKVRDIDVWDRSAPGWWQWCIAVLTCHCQPRAWSRNFVDREWSATGPTSCSVQKCRFFSSEQAPTLPPPKRTSFVWNKMPTNGDGPLVYVKWWL